MNMNSPADFALGQVRREFRRLNLDLPEALTTALADVDAYRAQLTAGATIDGQALADAVEAAVEAGRDPATEKTVLAEVVRTQLRPVFNNLQGRADKRSDHALAQHVPEIIEAMRPVVDNAAAALTAAHELVGLVGQRLDLADPRYSSVRPDHATPVARARDAIDQCERVARVWIALAPLAAEGRFRMNPAHRPLVLCELTHDEIAVLPDAHSKAGGPSATAALYAGHIPKLATLAEYAERTRKLKEQADAATQRRANERADALAEMRLA